MSSGSSTPRPEMSQLSQDNSPPGETLDAVKAQLETYKEHYERTRENLVLSNSQLRELHRENTALKAEARIPTRTELEYQERIRQLEELLTKAENEIERKETEHHHQVTELYKIIHSQTRKDKLTDDDIAEKMRELGLEMESWVMLNFRENGKLLGVGGTTDGFPQSANQRRTYIKSNISEYIHRMIFDKYHHGIQDESSTQCLQETERGVKAACSEENWKRWRSLTFTGLDVITKINQERLLDVMATSIEREFGKYAASESEPRMTLLRNLLQGCAAFKKDLSQQGDRYSFHYSNAGEVFVSENMEFSGGDWAAYMKVRLSIWPAIYKLIGETGHSIVRQELVWTMFDTTSEFE